MFIRETLISGHSKQNTLAIVKFIGGDPERFATLMSIFFEGKYRLTQRSAWPISVCAEKHPELLIPYLPKLVGQLKKDDVHEAVRRNVMRLLQFVEIPKRLQGKIYELCLEFISDPKETIAVRAFSMSVASRIAGDGPLLRELRITVENNLSGASPGIRSRARRILSSR